MMNEKKCSAQPALRNSIVFIFFIIWCLPYHLVSSEPIKFEHISLEHGLSQSSVFSICQDRRGFLWLGTEDGLNRYDGYEMVIYRYVQGDPNSLSGNNVQVIFEDSFGVLWIGTTNGLNRFNRKKETFTVFKRKDPDTENPSNYNNISHNKIMAIDEGKDGELWVGTLGGGLNRLVRNGMKFEPYKHLLEEPDSLSNDKVKAVYIDHSGILWVGTEGGGLDRFNSENKSFTHFKNNPEVPGSLSNNIIRVIFEDSLGTLWIGTKEGGLNKFDHESGTFVHYKHNPQDSHSISDNYVHSIYEDNAGIMWIGTYGGGLNRFDRKTGIFVRYRHTPDIPTTLSNDRVFSIHQDDGGILWIGTEGGLNKYTSDIKKFFVWRVEPGNPNSLPNKMVWSIFKDQKGKLWIGTDGGLTKMDREKRKTVHWTHNPRNPFSLSDNCVYTIYEDQFGVLWLGTRNGLNRFDRGKDRFSCYMHDPKDLFSLSDNDVFAILEDSTGVFWVGTRNGLNRLDRDTGHFAQSFKEYRNPDSLCNNRISCIYEDSRGTIWIGTKGGVSRWNPEKGTFTSWYSKEDDPYSLSHDNVQNIYEDKSGTLWIGTAVGLNKFDREKERFIHFTRKDGLPSDKINAILEDDLGRLWFSTNNGVSRFDPKNEKRPFRNYDDYDGLQSKEFNGSSCFRSADGEMFFGGVKGFNSFYPDRMVDNPHKPPIVITDFQLFNQSVNVGEKHEYALAESVTVIREIRLSYMNYFFGFEFAALDFKRPEKNMYQYKMEGFDKEWINTDASKRFAPYTKLPPGHYTFRVRGSNNDFKWNEAGVSVKVIITPPFWKTWWFQIFLGAAFVLVLTGGHLYRTKRLRDKLSEQKRVQDILRKSRDLAEFRRAEVEKLIAAISALLIAVDSDGEIFQWNETAEKFFGIRVNSTKGRFFVDLLKDCIEPGKLQEIIERGLHGEVNTIQNFEIPVILEKKGERLLLSTINPILDRSGQRLGFLLLAEDVTRRKEEERQRFLSQKLESLGQMAANIAHEIKNPLQYIGNNGCFISDSISDFSKFYNFINQCLTDIEQAGGKDVSERIKEKMIQYDIAYILDEVPRASDQIVSGVSRLSGIIQSMKEFAHPGRGVMEKADVHQLLESTLVMLRNKRKKMLDIQTDLCHTLPRVACYPGELSQVFLNLLINAADAIQEKGEPGVIKITTRIKNGKMEVSIADTGCGIPEAIKEDVFHLFFTTKGVDKGTGQGLSMAHKIITEKHKGKLFFESKVGVGTTFYIHLPIEGEN